MAYTTFDTVSTAIGKVSQDIRTQLSSSNGTAGQPILIDYVNRIHKQMLRFSRWGFLLSEEQFFMTTFGQTDYWIGPTAGLPAGMVDTTLNLSDVDKIKENQVRDYSNNRLITRQDAQPIGWALNYRSGQSRQAPPRTYVQDWNDPNIIHLYPASDNNNTYTPQPEPPVLKTSAAGALAQRTYYVQITLVDSIGGESQGSNVSSYITIPANHVLVVRSPKLYFAQNASGVLYNQWNVYAAQASSLSASAEGTETKQTASPVAIGTDWTEPTSGLIAGTNVPTTSTLAEMEGYVIGFRYQKNRADLAATTDSLQIPNDYTDVLVHGVNAMAWKLLEKQDQAQESLQLYQAGLKEMIADKNLFPKVDFVRPDPGSYVNMQTLGVLPPEF